MIWNDHEVYEEERKVKVRKNRKINKKKRDYWDQRMIDNERLQKILKTLKRGKSK